MDNYIFINSNLILGLILDLINLSKEKKKIMNVLYVKKNLIMNIFINLKILILKFMKIKYIYLQIII
jgi:hypothetical protein